MQGRMVLRVVHTNITASEIWGCVSPELCRLYFSESWTSPGAGAVPAGMVSVLIVVLGWPLQPSPEYFTFDCLTYWLITFNT